MAGLFISLPKLSPERAHRTNKGLGTLQRSVLQNAPSSLLVLFGPQSVASQERLGFFYPLHQIHGDDRIKPGIAGEARTPSSPGGQPGQGALVAAGRRYSAAAASSFTTGFSSRSWNFV